MLQVLPARVLVIDDDDALCRHVSAWLSEATFDVVSFTVPADALKFLENASARIALIDLNLPNHPSDELIGAVRRLSRDIGVIALAAFPDPKQLIAAVRAGAQDILEKPLQPGASARSDRAASGRIRRRCPHRAAIQSSPRRAHSRGALSGAEDARGRGDRQWAQRGPAFADRAWQDCDVHVDTGPHLLRAEGSARSADGPALDLSWSRACHDARSSPSRSSVAGPRYASRSKLPAAAGADLVELRADLIDNDDAIAEAIAARPDIPLILTIRTKAEGGTWEGDDAIRAKRFSRLAKDLRGFIDLEFHAWGKSAELRTLAAELCVEDGERRLILSHHDFDATPADLIEAVTPVLRFARRGRQGGFCARGCDRCVPGARSAF